MKDWNQISRFFFFSLFIHYEFTYFDLFFLLLLIKCQLSINRQHIFRNIKIGNWTKMISSFERERMANIMFRKESKHRVLIYIKFKNSLNIVTTKNEISGRDVHASNIYSKRNTIFGISENIFPRIIPRIRYAFPFFPFLHDANTYK